MSSIAIDIDPATKPAIDLDTLKDDLRIGGDELDHVLETQYIPDATVWAEAVMQRSIIEREHRWHLSDLRWQRALYLPRGYVSAVESLAYINNGATVTLTGPTSAVPGTDYQELLPSEGLAQIMPNQGETWPSVDLDAISPVIITYTAGWPTWESVPAPIKRGITARVYEAMENKGLIKTEPGFDADFTSKLLSAWNTVT